MSILLSMLVPHVPSITHEDQAPEFQKAMVAGMKKMEKEIRELEPDGIVLISCHWPSTFFHYVDCTPVHKGLLTAMEAPDLIKDVPYEFKGDEELGMKLYEAGLKQDYKYNQSMIHFMFGTMVVLFHYVT